MYTHKDKQHFVDQLKQRAKQDKQQSQIAGGKSEEKVLDEWTHYLLEVRHLPPDEQGILRISIGGGNETPVPLNYCTFRGDLCRCVDLLEDALAALKSRT